MNRIKVLLLQVYATLDHLVVLLPNTFKFFGFPIYGGLLSTHGEGYPRKRAVRSKLYIYISIKGDACRQWNVYVPFELTIVYLLSV